ncbi:MAG: HEAT repeat domain-containing protein [Methanomicrobiales archaeon]|nr:HEAT repeat domain-containing protein [Methanomicrobiales archaeon]
MPVVQDKVGQITRKRGARRLASLLASPEPKVRDDASSALSSLGDLRRVVLLESLQSRTLEMRIGAIESLERSPDPACNSNLMCLLSDDESYEVRCAAALAIEGEGEGLAREALIRALQDPDKYVRLAAAWNLLYSGLEPPDGEERVWFLIALGQWEEVAMCGKDAVVPLQSLIRWGDGPFRTKALEVLAIIGGVLPPDSLKILLAEPRRELRSRVLGALQKFDVPWSIIPAGVWQGRRWAKEPRYALVLNIFFPGLGYNYLGAWYGFLIFQANLTTVLIASLLLGPLIPMISSYCIGILLGLHAWTLARRIPPLEG